MMKRVAVFAHYDRQGSIQDYVLYYLKELQKFVDKIVFVSDTNLSEKELLKVAPFVVKSIAYRHGEYDFGSYKRGFIYAKENGLLEDCEELIFANDSCYAPVLPFDEMFNKMSPQNLDFWGVTMNTAGLEIVDGKQIRKKIEYVQSYFITFKPSVFCSKVFIEFIESIKKQESKDHVFALYEVKMTNLLLESGFVYDVYCRLSYVEEFSQILFYKELIKTGRSPFIKRSVLLHKDIYKKYPIFTRNLINMHTNYNYNLIKSDKKINKQKHLKLVKVCLFLKELLRLFHSNRVMKLGVAYNLFDGEELLEASIKSIRDSVDYICVIYQTISYYGNKANPNIENFLKDLLAKGLIDEIYHYDKVFVDTKNKHSFEREKRDIGLKLCRKKGMTHFMSLDVDEFYDSRQLEFAKRRILKKNIQSTACSIYEYLKSPKYRLVNSYTYSNGDEYNFYVPFIMKIRKFWIQKHNNKTYYTYVDPTRALNNKKKFYLFPVQDVVMHHMSTVRKDLDLKYNNSNLNASGQDIIKTKINMVKRSILDWDFESNRIGDSEYALFQNKLVKKVDDKFGINI